MTYQKPSKKSGSSSTERQKETITFRDVNWWVFAGVVAVIAVTALLSRSQRTLPDDLEGVPGEFESLDSGVVSQPLQWSQPPELAIDPENVDYVATLRLPGGDIVIDLLEEDAPITVNNFVFLANQGYYNGVTFHRVIAGFMAQGGDPTGTGTGGPGYRFEDETDNGLLFDRPYLLAMANAGPNTNGSQFFITFVPTSQLNGAHTIFGEVIEGTDVVDAIPLRDPLTASEPGMVMLAVEIEERPK